MMSSDGSPPDKCRQEGLQMIGAGDDYDAFDKFLDHEYLMFRHRHDKRIGWETTIMGCVYNHAGPEALWSTMASVTPPLLAAHDRRDAERHVQGGRSGADRRSGDPWRAPGDHGG